MPWYGRLLFVTAAALVASAFVRKEMYYLFADGDPERRMPVWLARTVSGLLVVFFIWLACLK